MGKNFEANEFELFLDFEKFFCKALGAESDAPTLILALLLLRSFLNEVLVHVQLQQMSHREGRWAQKTMLFVLSRRRIESWQMMAMC